MKRSVFYFLFLALAVFLSCKKDPQPVQNSLKDSNFTNDVRINITNVADSAIVQIVKDTIFTSATPKYVNAAGDTFSISKLRYYISNIKLKQADGSYYYEPHSYHLVDASDTINTCGFTLKNVPMQSYTEMEFIIGVDSAQNCGGAQTGDLDPLKDMFWSWGQGYIFYKFEGYTSSLPSSGNHNLIFHIGGFIKSNSYIRSAVVPMGSSPLVVESGKVPTIYMKTNVLEAFRNGNTLSFSYLTSVTATQAFKQISSNYTDMFTIAAIK